MFRVMCKTGFSSATQKSAFVFGPANVDLFMNVNSDNHPPAAVVPKSCVGCVTSTYSSVSVSVQFSCCLALLSATQTWSRTQDLVRLSVFATFHQFEFRAARLCSSTDRRSVAHDSTRF